MCGAADSPKYSKYLVAHPKKHVCGLCHPSYNWTNPTYPTALTEVDDIYKPLANHRSNPAMLLMRLTNIAPTYVTSDLACVHSAT